MDVTTLDDAVLCEMIAAAHMNTERGYDASRQALLAQQALGTLYDRYGRLIYSIAMQTVGDGATAEEITQDVFVRVWEGAHTYRADMAKFRSWIISIARHRAIDELRRRGVRVERLTITWGEPEGGENDLEQFPELIDTLNPEEQTEQLMRQRGIRQAVAQLPQDQRQVLGMAFFYGLSHSEIAEQLGQPLGTVKSRIRLAMQKLRDVLQASGLVDK